jgi:hypothetical protein
MPVNSIFILICRRNLDLALGKVWAAGASLVERIKWGRPTLAAEKVTVLASLLQTKEMATAVATAAEVAEAVSVVCNKDASTVTLAAVSPASVSVVAAAALRVRMGLTKQAEELDPHKPVDPGRA